MADPARHGVIEKEGPYAEHLGDVEKSEQIPQFDKFGSAAKVDPREIALVRKIDCYMMVWPVYPLLLCNGRLTAFSQRSGRCIFSTSWIEMPSSTANLTVSLKT